MYKYKCGRKLVGRCEILKEKVEKNNKRILNNFKM